MSRLTDLIAQAKANDPTLGADLEAEIRVLQERRPFGLNFERHQPEAVELPGRPVRKGDKVRVLPPRGETCRGDQRLWRVARIEAVDGERVARLELAAADAGETATALVDDLVVVAEFRDPIYPGLRSTGRVERGGDKPFHTVINAENYHALQTLLYTHRGKVDCIYIDPPYNTGAKDWKYNNDYVDGEDLYRHSKWLAFMERRLQLAKDLLNPEDSVLIVTIDEKEVHRLGLLLQQTFPDARVQMISSVINPSGAQRRNMFWRTDEYVYFVMIGSASPGRWITDMTRSADAPVKRRAIWNSLRRRGVGNSRSDRPGCFYPVYVNSDGAIVHIGDALSSDENPGDEPAITGAQPTYPIRQDGSQGRYECNPERSRELLRLGYLRYAEHRGTGTVQYLRESEIRKIDEGAIVSRGSTTAGYADLVWSDDIRAAVNAKTHWSMPSHDADQSGSRINRLLIRGRSFTLPKCLYAIEDALRFFVQDKPRAVIADFFAGSGTTAHAVMRLNRQDGGTRRSVSVTNNEVDAEQQVDLRRERLRPGDGEWESQGICDFITKPRIRAAVTGVTPDGDAVKGDYKFTDEFPMSEGFEENVEFFTLTYETPWRVARNRDFAAVAPLLWMRAGSQGRRIDVLPEAGWDVADTYGVLANLDRAKGFLAAVTHSESVWTVFVVTDDDRRFQMVCAGLPERVEPVRLYESYLRNFEINTGRE